MGKTFSVIIPSHNRASQLLLTLAAFDLQTLPKKDFEVIVIDDGSTDHTGNLVRDLSPSYSLIYTTTGRQSGIAAASNQGVSLAQKDYVVRCDADFVVVPEFLQTLDAYHRRHGKTVVSGIPYSWNTTYTHYHPGFSQAQREEMYQVVHSLGLWQDGFWGEYKQVVPLLTPEDLMSDFGRIRDLEAPCKLGEGYKRAFAATDVAPWLLYVGRCASVARRHVLAVGGFDTRLVRYGLEDWELGYRLHKSGLSFQSVRRTIGYHQEHPRGSRAWELESNRINLKLILDKYELSHPEWNLFVTSPPWSRVIRYKKKLRKLEAYKQANHSRRARRVERKWRRSAQRFFDEQSGDGGGDVI